MRRFFNTTALGGISAGVALAAFAGLAHAQETVDDAPNTDFAVGEIVVTAQKRSQNVQDVPMAVQVIGGDQLEAAAVREFTDLTKVAPSLIVRPADNPVNASVSIRGVGTFAFGVGVEPSVAVVVDDVPIAFQARAFADLADVERIEVLRGPQSTLYGKSASAGLINIVTPGPTRELTGKVSALATTDDEVGLGAMISGPITDTLRFRSSNSYTSFEGNIDNLYNGEKVNGRETFATRNKLVWDPTDKFSATLAVDYLKGDTTAGRPFIALSPDARLRGNAAWTPAVFAPGVNVGPNNSSVVNNVTTGSDYEDFAQSLKLTYDLGFATLISVTANDRYKMLDAFDQDETALSVNNYAKGLFSADQFSQEIRLVSDASNRLRYTLGAFHADVNYRRYFFRGPAFSQANWDATSGSNENSVFGQLEYDVLEGTTLIGGLRLGREKIGYTFRDLRAGPAAAWADGASDDYATYRLGVQHKLADDVMVFATYATGHKGQSYDLTTGFNQARADLGPVRPESSEDIQVGVRSRLLDRRVTLNATLFNTEYDDFQAQGAELLPDGTQNFRLTNVGAIRTRGIEVESTARLVDGLTLSGSVAYLDAEITQFAGAQCWPGQTVAQGCAGSPARQNLAGERPPQAPKWKLSAGAEYVRPLAGDLEGVANVAANYQSSVNYSLNQDPLTVQKGYAVVNLSVGVRDKARGYQVMAFVNNLFDEGYYTNLVNNYGAYGNQLAVQAFLPRDFKRYGGVRASMTF